jgi:small nuclear ribonucleoprotein (snRNP)-like protein
MQCATSRIWFRQYLLIALLSLWVLPASAAPKTDVVIFKNGDKLTGELKSLKRGQLFLNTDATGTIGIEWDKISAVISNQQIQVETSNGTRYFGILATSDEAATIVVVTDDGPKSLSADWIIVMNPIEGGGIHALEVDVSVGYNFAKAGGVEQATLGVNMDFRSLLRIESLRFSTILSDSDSQEASRRTNLGLQHTRLWRERWFSTGSLTFDQNDELGLNLRSSLGFGGGRYTIQSNSMLLSFEAGLQFSRENLVNEPEDLDSLESIFTAKWDWFLFDDPELDWSSMFQLIPSLTEKGRVRGELDTTLSWEIIGDLKWAVSLYGSWDNQPQSTGGATSDYGVNTSLAYEF